MMTVMIVEDEPRILRDLKKLVEGDHTAFEVTHLLTNGQQAISALIENKDQLPDILITDIQMPVVNGLDLIAYVRDNQLPINPVILSGYREFDYAKRAMTLGVQHYLLKPVDNTELQMLLNTLTLQITTLKKATQRDYLNSLIEGKTPATLPTTSVPLPTLTNYLVLMCAGTFPSRAFANDPGKLDFWKPIHLEDILAPYLSSEETVLSFNGGTTSEQVLLLSLNEPTKDKFTTISKTLYSKLKPLSYPITFITGDELSSLDDINNILQKYRQLLIKKIVIGKSQLLNLKDSQSLNTEKASEVYKNLLIQLPLLLKQGHYTQYKNALRTSLQNIESTPTLQINLEEFLKELFSTALRLLEFEDSSRLSDTILEISDLISASRTITELVDNVMLLTEDLLAQNVTQNLYEVNCSNELLIQKIEKYIQTHMNESINQQSLSSIFGMVPSYLSKLFRKYKGLSPTEYIIFLRIEKAKELIKNNPNMLAKDIANLVGYPDPLYFSKIFKKETGVSISEYKNLEEAL